MLARLPLDRSSHLRLLLAKNRRFCRRRRTNEAAFSSFVSPKILRLKRPFFGRLNCNCNRGRTTEERRPPTKTESGLLACPTATRTPPPLLTTKLPFAATLIARRKSESRLQPSERPRPPPRLSSAHSQLKGLSLSLCRPSHIPVFFILSLSLSLFPLHRYRRPTND